MGGRAGQGRGAGVRLVNAPALRSPGKKRSRRARSLKVIDRQKGYSRLGDTSTNEDLLWVRSNTSVTNLRAKIKGCRTRCPGAPGGVTC